MTDLIVRPLFTYLLLFLLAIQGISGIYGGAYLVFDPTGESLEMPLTYLSTSPFTDYFIPGFILLTILGIYPLIVVYHFWKRDRQAWFGSVIVGSALVIWIIVEILMIGYQSGPPLQLIYGLVGIFILIISYTPSIKRYFQPS